MGYWTGREYLGLGLGASSYIQGCRFRNEPDLQKYSRIRMDGPEAGEKLHLEMHPLTEKEQMEEFMFLGLRKIRGVSRKEFRRIFGKDLDLIYEKTLKKYLENGMLQEKGDRIFLSEEGILVSNQIFADFLFD